MSTKPAPPYTVNGAHPQCPDAAFLFGEGSGTTTLEVVNGGSATLAGGYTWTSVGSYGAPCLTLDGTATANYTSDSHVSNAGVGAFSYVAVYKHANTAWSTSVEEDLARKQGEGFLCVTLDGFTRWFNFNTTIGDPDSLFHRSGAPPINADQVLIGVTAGNAASALYLDGLAIGGQVILGADSGFTTANPLVMGESFKGNLESIFVFKGSLTTGDVAAIQADPWAWVTHAASASMAASPSTVATGSGAQAFTLTGTGTSWTSGTTAGLAGSGGASGFAIIGQVCNFSASPQTITGTFNPGTHSGTLTWSDNTDAATATTTVTLGLPNPPTGVNGTPGNAQVSLNATPPVSGGTVATYNLYRGTSPGGESGTPIATGIASFPYIDATAVNGTTYYYEFKSVNATGVSASFSNEAGPYTPTSGPTMTVSPTTAATGAGTVVFTVTGHGSSWTSGTTASIGGLGGAAIVNQSVTGQVITVTVSLGLAAGTLVFHDSADAATATASITLGAPQPPTGLSGVPGPGKVTLGWVAPASGGLVATYNAYVGTTQGGESGTAAVTGIVGTTVDVTGLTPGTPYWFTAKSVNTTATSAASNEAGSYIPTALPTSTVRLKGVLIPGLGTALMTVYDWSDPPNVVIAAQAVDEMVDASVPTGFFPIEVELPNGTTAYQAYFRSGSLVSTHDVEPRRLAPDGLDTTQVTSAATARDALASIPQSQNRLTVVTIANATSLTVSGTLTIPLANLASGLISATLFQAITGGWKGQGVVASCATIPLSSDLTLTLASPGFVAAGPGDTIELSR